MTEGDAVTTDGRTHETREACVDAELWLTEEPPTKEVTTAHGYHVHHQCPVCGREYSYSYTLVGLWSEDDEEYVWMEK